MTETIFLKPGGTYRIYGEAIGNETSFFNEHNYFTFLDCYLDYVFPFTDTLAYCLMPHRYDFLIKIRDRETFDQLVSDNNKVQTNYSHFISRQIGNFILSYTKLFNLEQERAGPLFIKPFKRKIIYNELHLLSVMKEIHCSPVNAKLCSDPEQWNFSSYSDSINYRASFVCHEVLMDYFSNRQGFIDFHSSDDDELDAVA